MKSQWIALKVIAASIVLAGCATTDNELSQKEKDKIARDMERQNQKEAQAQAKMMREASGSGTRRNGR